MSFELMGAITAKAVKCARCANPIARTEDYEAQFMDIPVLGATHRQLVSEQVTLVCDACGWIERTANWRQHISTGE